MNLFEMYIPVQKVIIWLCIVTVVR